MSPGPEFVRPPRGHGGRIYLAPSDPAWPQQYIEVANRIKEALGPVAAVIEHVGSTSVAGLVAKPLLDVLLLVPDPADEGAYVSQLEAVGFLLHVREPDWHHHRLLRAEDPDVNVHVFAVGSPEAVRMLLFRDRLRINQDERALYEETKRRSPLRAGGGFRIMPTPSRRWWRESSRGDARGGPESVRAARAAKEKSVH